MSNELIETQSTEVAEVSHRDTGPGAMMLAAVQSGSAESVAALTPMYEAFEKGRIADAKAAAELKRYTAFIGAKIAAVNSIPAILENEKNDHLKNTYASADQILAIIRPVLRDNGLLLDFTTERDGETHVKTIGQLRHVDGHSETSEISLPRDKQSNQVHGTGSSNTYGQRYVMRNMFGLSIGDGLIVDDDGNAAGGGSNNRPLTETELIEFEELIEASKSDRPILEKTLNTRFGVKSIEHLTTGKAYDFALSAMRSKVNA